jgi:putative resolvase
MSKEYMKLSEYGKKLGVTYKTAWNHFKRGLIPNAKQDELGNVYIPINNFVDYSRTALYARVSSNEMKHNLDRQLDRLIEYANRNNYEIIKSVKEIGSGMNDSRPKLVKLLNDNSWNVLIIEHKDRLTRFGFNYIETLLNQQNKKIIVINNNEDHKQSLMEDLISIIYSFSARMYGMRKRRKKKEIIDFLENND